MITFRSEVLAERIAKSIHKNYSEASSVAVLEYALIAVINTSITTSIVLIVSLLTGDFLRALMAIFAFMFLRYFSGGLHLKSANLCNIVSSLIVMISIYTPINYWYNGLVLNVLSIAILLCYAPSGIKRSILNPKYYPLLKLISITIVCINFFVHSPTLSIVFFIQSLTTTTFIQKLN